MSRPDNSGSSFLGRWAKRKQEVQLHSKQEQSSPAAEVHPSPALPAVHAPASETDVAEPELPLPSLDDVLPGGDISVFLQKHVPDALRNAALRKAWLADPDISSFIEMADYQWDFTRPDSIPGWGSSLQGLDVKGMVEKVFNNVKAPEQEAHNNADGLADSDAAKINQNEQNIIMNAENGGKLDISSEEPSLSSAMPHPSADQENTADSGVYHAQKKRHGGALPT